MNRKRIIFATCAASTLGLALLFQNCDGSSSRSIDYSIPLSSVEAQLQNYDTAAATSGSTTDKANADAVIAMHQNYPDSTLFYGCTGTTGTCTMGPSAEDVDFSSLTASGSTASATDPASTIVFLAYRNDPTNGPQAGIILTGGTFSGGSSTSTASTATTVTTATTETSFAAFSKHILDSGATPTPTPAAASDGSVTFSLFGYSALNDDAASTTSASSVASQAVGALSDDSLSIPVTINGIAATLVTQDICDGDLCDTPQFKILISDGNGGTYEAATLNMVTPTDD